ncbi:MAG: hypothetical protein BGN87_09685 [Rhizobiales bacterium 65-79]|jgi:hypothetical protein|nr:hypothetical protein [Hyphomicrobiales bacterium]OJU03649.1 MAG: hypothetical protein BGN87_09685 [Rhizobiales bacterium 65-79]
MFRVPPFSAIGFQLLAQCRHRLVVSAASMTETLSASVLSKDEIDLILASAQAIAARDHLRLAEFERIDPRTDDGFWYQVNAFGNQEFIPPSADNIRKADVIRFSDGRGSAVDVFVKIKGADKGEFSGMTIAFEVIRTMRPSRIGVVGVEW